MEFCDNFLVLSDFESLVRMRVKLSGQLLLGQQTDCSAPYTKECHQGIVGKTTAPPTVQAYMSNMINSPFIAAE